jgi:hydroxyacylglutathione hydrolase
VSNLKYALHVEPDNALAKQKLEWALKIRERNEPSIPSTIAEELQINPFMRCDLDKNMRRYKQNDAISCMREMRREKDAWKPA